VSTNITAAAVFYCCSIHWFEEALRGCAPPTWTIETAADDLLPYRCMNAPLVSARMIAIRLVDNLPSGV
jgi:hypothetical protein